MTSVALSNPYSEFREQMAQETNLGVNSAVPTCIARVGKDFAKNIRRFVFKNKGESLATIVMRKRGIEYALTPQNITALRVGSTNQLRGKLPQARVKPGTVVIADANASPQTIKDTFLDGRLFQVSGPAGPSYPQEVGTIDYNNGAINFTFLVNLTTNITAAFTHSNWVAFGSAITFDVGAGGGENMHIITPTNMQNWLASIRDEKEIGFFASCASGKTMLILDIYYYGSPEDKNLPILKGEISGYPLHNN